MMSSSWCSRYWQLRLAAALAIVGAVGTVGSSAIAQVRPDNTLGAESSRVTSAFPGTDQIDGGATRGTNLFHSFSEFSVPIGGMASFNNALNIQNIISRVTGGTVSNIDGLIRANGTANLFLINPSGIIFGHNATLAIGGSFVGSTASSLNFADGTKFSATAQSTKPLLTVSVPIGLQLGGTSGTILNQSQATDSNGNSVGLQVYPGKTLALVGGSVSLDGGTLTAAGGRVELGGLSGAGTVGLKSDGSLSFPQGVQRADVSLTNGSVVDVVAQDGGRIAINAQNINISGGSFLDAGIGEGLGSVASQAGDIELSAQGAINIANSFIFNNVESGAEGNAGNIDITAGSLEVTDGAVLESLTRGRGNAGSVNIYAHDTVSFNGASAFSTVESRAEGNGGNIDITAGSLEVTDGAVLESLTRGRGNAGSVNIYARDTVSFNGASAFSTVESRAEGNGGNIDITAESLSVTDGARLNAGTSGQGDAGSVNINARGQVSFNGIANGLPSAALSNVEESGTGNAGGVSITAGSLSVTNGAQLESRTRGQGNAGSVNINASGSVTFDGVSSNGWFSGAYSTVEDGAMGKGGSVNIMAGSLSVKDGARLNAGTSGQGDAGSVIINARDTVSFDGVGLYSDGVNTYGLPSAALSNVEASGTGNAGGVSITAGSLSVTNGAQLESRTRGQGNAGSVNINASGSVTFDGMGSFGSSGAYSTVESRAVGKGGGVNITTGSLDVTKGAGLFAYTAGRGDAGNVTINARDPVSFDGGYAFSTVEASAMGNAGNIDITTGSLSVTNGAQLQSLTRGQGNAGSVRINAHDQVSFDGRGSAAYSTVETKGVGNGDNIDITAGSLSVTNGARLAASTRARGRGNAGSVNINARDQVSFEGVDVNGYPSAALSGVETKETIGNGGEINITAGSLSVTNGAQLEALTRGQGNAGSVRINARDRVSFDGMSSIRGYQSGAFSTVDGTAVGNGGGIDITADSLSVTNGAILTASTAGQGNGGNITFKANTLEAVNGGQVLTTSSSSGKAGNITLNKVSDSVTLSGPTSGLRANTDANSTGDGGTIFIDPNQLTITNGAEVSVNSQGTGKGGSIQVQAGSITLDKGAMLSARANSGNGGNIMLNVQDLLLLLQHSQISASADTAKVGADVAGGNIDINTRFLVALPSENSDITATAFKGRGGNIQIADQGIFGIQRQAQDTPQSDITASSQLGINGTVQINTPVINPILGVVVLPTGLVDASRLIAQGCPAYAPPQARKITVTPSPDANLSARARNRNTGRERMDTANDPIAALSEPSKFVVSGRGGIPPSPTQPLSSDAVLTNWATLSPKTNHRSGKAHSSNRTSPPPTQIVEATGWVIGPKGEVILTAPAPTVTPDIPWLRSAECHAQ